MRFLIFFLWLIQQPLLIAQRPVYDSIILKHLSSQKLVGLSLGIIEGGKIIHSKGYGMANLETETPVRENSVYKIGLIL